jgi:AcrR family transcriptional regulator
MSKPKPPAPAPIWAHPAPGTRRPKLTRDQIATCALAIADAEGIAAVSMRRIAEDLGVGTMTLYYYVRTKDDLLALMDDHLTGEVLIPKAKLPKGWRAAMTAIARASRAAFIRHPWALTDLDGGRIGPNGMRHVEQSMAAMATAPLSDADKISVISAVDDYVFGHILRMRDPWKPGASDPQALRQVNEFIDAQIATGEFPQLAALIGDEDPTEVFARMSLAMTNEARFERGLEALLDGFEQSPKRKRDENVAGAARRRGVKI